MTPAQKLPQRDPNLIAFGSKPTEKVWFAAGPLRMALVFSDLTEGEILQVLFNRLVAMAPSALKSFDDALAEQPRPTAGVNELKRLHNSIERLATTGVNISGTLADAVWDELQEIATELIEQRRLIKRECSQQDLLDAFQRISLANYESGTEQGMLLREAKVALSEYINNEFEVPLVTWLIQSWLVFRLTESPAEASVIVSRAISLTETSPIARLARACFAWYRFEEEALGPACEVALTNLVQASGILERTEAAIITTACGRDAVAKSVVESALNVSPSSIICLLADPRCRALANPLLDLALKNQTKVRREAQEQIGAWQGMVRKVEEARRILAGPLAVSYELMESHRALSQSLPDVDMLVATAFYREARAARIDLIKSAEDALVKEQRKRAENVRSARRSVDSAWDAREARIAKAMEQQQKAAASARSMLGDTTSEGERVQKGTIYGVSTGCGFFILYMITAVIVGGRGLQIGFGTPLGNVLIGVAALPVAISVIVQLSFSMRRMNVDSQVNEAVAKASEQYDRVLRESDEVYRAQVESHRLALKKAEDDLKKADQAAAFLGNRAA